jgi:methionyl-tRNA formyltransferase
MTDSKDLRIAFMGTPEFAVACLQALLEAGFRVVAVVTAPDRPAGRGQQMRPPAVKEFALSRGLQVLQPARLRDPEFLEQLKALGVNLQVVVAFRMLPREVWSLPAYGTFNLHASLLPDYRGAAPINWALIRGERETGVTTFFIDEEIDTGKIILQRKVAIGAGENAGELHDRLMAVGADLVVETVQAIARGPVPTMPQKHLTTAKPAPKLFREDCRIRWDQPSREIYNLIRGLSPYPAAWTELINGAETKGAKVYEASLTDTPAQGPAGSLLVADRALLVNTADKVLELKVLQLEGKKKMPAAVLLNGLHLEKSAHFR